MGKQRQDKGQAQTGPPTEETPFRKFERLARRVATVPKTEADKQRCRHKPKRDRQ